MSRREWIHDHCPVCDRLIAVRADGYFRVHGPVGVGCNGAQRQASPAVLSALGLADTATALAGTQETP